MIKRANHAGLGMLEHEIAGQRRERVAALGIGRVPEIIRHQPQLVVAAGLIGEAVEQFGEAVHDGDRLACLLVVGDAVRLVLVAIADDVERPRLQSLQAAPMHQRVFLPVRDPDFAGAGRLDGLAQAVPVGVIGNHQRQLHEALPRAGAHPHPAGGDRR